MIISGLGGREPESANRPMQVTSSQIEDDVIVALDAGSVHNLALGQSGSVYVWGSNKEGQLGLGAEGEESLFAPTKLDLASGMDSSSMKQEYQILFLEFCTAQICLSICFCFVLF